MNSGRGRGGWGWSYAGDMGRWRKMVANSWRERRSECLPASLPWACQSPLPSPHVPPRSRHISRVGLAKIFFKISLHNGKKVVLLWANLMESYFSPKALRIVIFQIRLKEGSNKSDSRKILSLTFTDCHPLEADALRGCLVNQLFYFTLDI